jgi:transglutaminase-like putative cysteine protease
LRRYRILHRTYYNFSSEVWLGPHELRLRPRENHELRIESAILEISPTASLRWHRDAEDNAVAVATFSASTRQLSIISDLIVQQYNEAPIEHDVDDDAARPASAYSPRDRAVLAPYVDCLAPVPGSSFAQWLERAHTLGPPGNAAAVLLGLCRLIHTTLSYRIREEPGTQSAEDTLRRGSGSCRDFARLLMESARQLGFAARFVSGYLHAPPAADNYGATHAWAEAYLPGAGWKGFDPTLGLAVGADHFPVAVAREPEAVPPISGSITGQAESTLHVGVWVTPCAEARG